MNIAINLKKQATLNTMGISDEDKKSEYAWYIYIETSNNPNNPMQIIKSPYCMQDS